jgi:hypothetical protein
MELAEVKQMQKELTESQKSQNKLLEDIMEAVSKSLSHNSYSSAMTTPTIANDQTHRRKIISPSLNSDGATPLSRQFAIDSESRDQQWRNNHPDEEVIAALRDEKYFENCLKASYPKLNILRYLIDGAP